MSSEVEACDTLARDCQTQWRDFIDGILIEFHNRRPSDREVDLNRVLDPFRSYIDIRIKLAFAEQETYGKVLL